MTIRLDTRTFFTLASSFAFAFTSAWMVPSAAAQQAADESGPDAPEMSLAQYVTPGDESHEPESLEEDDDDWVVMSLSDDDELEPFPLTNATLRDEAELPVLEDRFGCPTVCTTQWLTAEHLLMWTKANKLPPLATTSPLGTDPGDAGVLNKPGTTVLFGGSIDDGVRNGLRLRYGRWLDDSQRTGIEGVYFSVFDDGSSGDFHRSTDQTPILARPFFSTVEDGEDSLLVSLPTVVDGEVDFSSNSELHSTSLLLRRSHRIGTRGRIDVLSGYRYFRFREGIRLAHSSVSTTSSGGIPTGTTFDFTDHFRAKNNFHGGELGLEAEFWRGIFSVELLAKVALGRVYRKSSIDGETVITTPDPGGTTATHQGGLLALPTNIGDFESSTFAALPEFGINVSAAVTDHVSVGAGYTLLMLNDIFRTGDMIDRTVNPTQLGGGALAGAARPAPQRQNQSDFWMQGLNFLVTLEH